MRRIRVLSLVLGAVVSAATAQQTFAVGVTDVLWANTSGSGSATLQARVHYPSLVGGTDAPVAPSYGGRPVVVFLHGYGLHGNDYASIGDTLAENGFVTVMLNTGQWDWLVLEADGRAMYSAIAAANSSPTSLFHQQLATNRIGVLGHSMGGGVASFLLFDQPGHPLQNPGFVCGLSLSPVSPGPAAADVHAPFGIVSGDGDVVTPSLTQAQPFYDALQPTRGLKFHYRMGPSCDHLNIAGLTPNSPGVFGRSMRIAIGFFGQFLGVPGTGLESVIGDSGLADVNLVQLDRSIASPITWAESRLRIGAVSRISVASENGFAAMLGAGSLISVPIPTALGSLWVDPFSAFGLADSLVSTQRLDVVLAVPNDMSLVGTLFAVQGGGATTTQPFSLGSAMQFRID